MRKTEVYPVVPVKVLGTFEVAEMPTFDWDEELEKFVREVLRMTRRLRGEANE